MCECVLSLVFWESGVNDFWMRRQGEGAWPGGMGAWPGGLGAWPGGPGGGRWRRGIVSVSGSLIFFFLSTINRFLLPSQVHPDFTQRETFDRNPSGSAHLIATPLDRWRPKM